MSTGYIKLMRNIQGTWIHKDPVFFKAYCDILYNVNWESKEVFIGGDKLICGIGEALYSLDNWAKIFGGDWNKGKVRRFFARLEKAHEIRTKSERKTTRLKLVSIGVSETKPHDNRTITERKATPTKELRINNTTTSTEFTPTSLDPNGLTNQEIAEHLDDIYKTPADIARMVKLSLGHEISDEKATELLESFLTKGLSEYYTHIKSKALILGKFQQWCKNGVEKFNKPKEKTEPQKIDISITDHYKKYYPDKWQYLDKIGKLKEYEAKFTDLKFKYSNIAKSHKNPTITAAFIFEAVQTHLNRHLSGSNEERRITSLTKWIERDLSDYKRNKADVRDEFYQWTQNKDK